MEAARGLVVVGVLVTIVAGFMVATTTWSMIGWVIGVIGAAVFLYGLVTVHAATAEVLVRARQIDMARMSQPQD
jgi:uncharacterized membrane protein